MPKRGPGLGLGLNRRQQTGFMNAVNQGNVPQFLGNRPGLNQRFINQGVTAAGTNPQAQRFTDYLNQSAANAAGGDPRLRPANLPAQGSPATGPGKGGGGGFQQKMPGTINGMSAADFQAQNPEMFAPGGMFGPSAGPQQRQGGAPGGPMMQAAPGAPGTLADQLQALGGAPQGQNNQQAAIMSFLRNLMGRG